MPEGKGIPPPRNATLDFARLAAACGIVLFHSGAPGAAIGYAALPFFLMVLIALALPGAARTSFPVFAQNRGARLVVPWVVWSAVYGALKLAEVAMTGKPLASEFALWMLLTGPALHLWFLPFAFVACLAVYPLARIGPDTRARVAAITLLTGTSLLALGGRQDIVLPEPLSQWLYALPAVLLGTAFGLMQSRTEVRAVCLGLGVAALCAMALGWTDGLVQIALAILAFGVCRMFPSQGNPWATRAAEASLTVYLCHPIMLSLLGRTAALPAKSLALAVTAILGSLVLAYLLQIVRPSRIA